MDPNAVLGSVDPQIGMPPGTRCSAASVLAALRRENPNREDQTLILGDVAAKAVRQVYTAVYGLLRGHLPDDRAREVAGKLSEARAAGATTTPSASMGSWPSACRSPMPCGRRSTN
jgi:hypothetical protein